MSELDGFTVERDGAVATIRLDVPGKLNRISMTARDQLSAVFAELDTDEAVRFVVLTGAGASSLPGATSPGSSSGRRGRSLSWRGTSPHRSGVPNR